MKLYTIGFTKKSAERFFNLLNEDHIERLLDIRLNPQGQLAGFAKKDDLSYFLSQLLDCEYHHMKMLAPTTEILSIYRDDKDWSRYVTRFEALMDERNIPGSLDRHFFEGKNCCFLCSEATPEKCHRRLVAERLGKYWQNIEIKHII
jgi:uncharacterized protein (DUF488 family)